ncbi:dienelactone hydrolase family protein [Noviherbaspirillum saxi]|uniref:Alpha/beta hydrolase n=1 Tax=Noviherbaspirillum saxi TaxID=2320863 RepID=A0A3A3FSF1_9BURK|nr:dienelactone hydrolase family protein [Noviherbaspirillum saxi]RJF99092.1 alpha/beta hydrolase [Noviherbaspirillum saxi]
MALSIQHAEMHIPYGDIVMQGALWLPADHRGVVVFANGSTRHRLKPPYDYVGSVLHNARLGTLWLDLVTAEEQRACQPRPGIAILAERLGAACDWLHVNDATSELPIALFGSGYGAAAALQLAVLRRGCICAIVLRGGRPDLASQTLAQVVAPTLLIVGGLDDGVLDVNRHAYAALQCKKRLEIIPGATHAFDEPGSMEVVARLARGWFLQHTHFTLM